MTAQILSPKSLIQWHKSIARENGTVAIVMGSFAILQPGNLGVIEEAAKLATHVCVVIEPETPEPDERPKQDAPSKRAEFVSFLRNVSGVCAASALPRDLDQLAPFIMVDCLAQPHPSFLRAAMRKAADRLVDFQPIRGCFTSDIFKTIRAGATPVSVPCGEKPRPDLMETVSEWRRQGKKLATVNGCFDILHLGHARMLSEARLMGDELIALVNDDASVRAYKGKERPVFPISFRLRALCSLAPVSMAYPFSGDDPLPLLAKIRPNVHVKGGAYEEERVTAEAKLIRTWGGRIEFRPMVEGYSTTRIINKFSSSIQADTRRTDLFAKSMPFTNKSGE